MTEWQVPELGSWQRRLQQGFAKQEAQLQQVEQRIQTASARHAQLEEECVRAPSLPPVEESSRLRHETKIREEELQMAAERIAYLRTRNENIARKNQDVAEAEKRLLDAREHERAAYIARLRAQTAELFASRQEQSEARAELADVARQVGEELAARVERVQQALHALLHAEPHEAAEARLEAAEAHRALLAWLEGAG